MLQKNLSLSECDLKFSESAGQFNGYGSVFNIKDDKNDLIMPGAYENVLKSGNPVQVFVNHGWLRGELPVGTWSDLREDDHGLAGDAELEMRMSSASDAYYALKARLVSGLSVAIMPDKDSIERKSDGTRVIHNILRLKEISIVDNPANFESRVVDVKMTEELNDIKTIRDLEHFLRDAGNFSKGLAGAIVNRAKVVFGQREADDEMDAKASKELEEVLIRLNQKVSNFNLKG